MESTQILRLWQDPIPVDRSLQKRLAYPNLTNESQLLSVDHRSARHLPDSQGISHLSFDNPDMSIKNADLPCIPSPCDILTDDTRETPDNVILTTFSANRRLNEEPGSPSLLSNIANNDKRIWPLTTDDARNVLENERWY
jgi:hypothetical protein